VIGLLLQPDHDFGTISQVKSVGLICRWTRSAKTENVFVCSRHQRLVTVVSRRCVQINLLTYLLTYLIELIVQHSLILS